MGKVQTDLCSHKWIANDKWSLYAFIDDSIGKVLTNYFDYKETLFRYYTATKQIFLNYKTPEEILTDKRTVFYYKAKEKKSLLKQTLIYNMPLCANNLETYKYQFCTSQKQNWIPLSFSSKAASPRTKTIQYQNYWADQYYLINVFIPNFNQKFSTQIDNNKNKMKI